MAIEGRLRDQRVLLVEDEYLIARAMERGLRKAGAHVLGPVPTVAQALMLLADEPDVSAAVLDINLGGQKVYPVADVLLARGVRCVFATGNDPADVPRAYAAVTRCQKPVDTGCIVKALAGSGTDASADATPADEAMEDMRAQLARHMRMADDAGQDLLAIKLCEAITALDDLLAR